MIQKNKRSNWFKQRGIQTQLFLAFGVVATFGIAVGITSFLSTQKTIHEYEKIARKNMPASVVVTNMRSIAKDVRAMVFKLGAVDINSDEPTTISARISELISEYDDATSEFNLLPLVESEKALFNTVHEKWKAYLAVEHRMVEALLKKTPEGLKEFNTLLANDFREQATEYFQCINELIGLQQEEAVTARASAESSERTGNYISIAMILIGFFVAAVIGLLLGRHLSLSLLEITGRLDQGATNVTHAVAAVSQMSQDLASSSQEQATALQETSSAMTEISATVAKNAASAEQSQKSAQTSQADVESGKAAIDSLIEALNDLESSNKTLFQQLADGATKMNSLTQIIKEIESKTKVINDIVFQTKLLSFNASVEAARAGEAGKGFAVVAEEVGSLARMSGTASTEISSMLLTSIDRVNQIAVESKASTATMLSDAADRYESIRERVKACESSFERIYSSTSQVVQGMDEICAATAEQNAGMSEISKAVAQLNMTTQANTGASEKAFEAANHLAVEVSAMETATKVLLTAIKGTSKEHYSSGHSSNILSTETESVRSISFKNKGEASKHQRASSE